MKITSSKDVDQKNISVADASHVEIDEDKGEVVAEDRIEAAGEAKKFLKKLLKDALKEAGLKIEDSKKNADGSVTHKMSIPAPTEENPDAVVWFYVNGVPADEKKTKVTLSFKYPDPDDIHSENYKTDVDAITVDNTTDAIAKACTEFIDKKYKGKGIEDGLEDELGNKIDLTASTETDRTSDVPDAKMLKATFKKIKANVGYNIQLTNIFATYQPAEVLVDLEMLAGDEEFVNSLPLGQPIAYAVSTTDEGLEVAELPVPEASDVVSIDEACRECAYDAILGAAYKLYFDLEYCKYTASGADMSGIINLAENFLWRVHELIDSASKMVIEDKLILMHPIDRIRQIELDCQSQETKWFNFISLTRCDVEGLINAMKLYCDNLSEDKQDQIKSWIRSWSYEIAYTLNQAEK